MNAQELAETVLEEIAVPEVLATAKEMVQSGEFVWLFDPQHENVIGLVEFEDRKTAWVIVYVNAEHEGDGHGMDDFEMVSDFEEMAEMNAAKAGA